MRTALLFIALSVAAALVFVPHVRSQPDSFKSTTLGGIYWDLLSHLPSRWNAERATFLAAVAAGVFASCFPIVLAMMLRWYRPGSGSTRGIAYGAVALIAFAGATANALFILLNQATFTFGGRPVPGGVVAFAVTVALVQSLIAIVSLTVAVSPRFAAFAS
jgi:hypothetical protein